MQALGISTRITLADVMLLLIFRFEVTDEQAVVLCV
jgi:hypothetical protein